MKPLLLILTLSLMSFSTSDINIFYVLDSDGKEVAKRVSGKEIYWEVSDPKIALEEMYKEKEIAEAKLKLAQAVLKNLDQNGNISDKQKYFLAVSNYNNFLKQNK